MQQSKIPAILERIFADLDLLTEEIEPFGGLIKAAGGKPIAECGASEKIKIAIAICQASKIPIPGRTR
jgi:hypothetical protein